MNRLKYLREEKSMLQEDLAKVLEVSQKTISNYETGERDMSTETLTKLSEYFNVSIDYLLGKSNIRNPEKVEIDTNKLYIGLSTNDYENITDKQKEQITELAKLILKDNLKNKDNKQNEQ